MKERVAERRREKVEVYVRERDTEARERGVKVGWFREPGKEEKGKKPHGEMEQENRDAVTQDAKREREKSDGENQDEAERRECKTGLAVTRDREAGKCAPTHAWWGGSKERTESREAQSRDRHWQGRASRESHR